MPSKKEDIPRRERKNYAKKRRIEKHPERAFWEQWRGETPDAYAAFQIFREMPMSQRSQTKVAQQLGKSNTMISKWARQYMWIARCEAKDAEEDRILQLESIEDKVRMHRRHLTIAKLFQNKIIARMQELNPSELTPNQLAQWFEISSKVERQAMGESTERFEITGAGVRSDNDLTGAVFDDPELAELAVRFMEQARLGEDEPSGSS